MFCPPVGKPEPEIRARMCVAAELVHGPEVDRVTDDWVVPDAGLTVRDATSSALAEDCGKNATVPARPVASSAPPTTRRLDGV